MIHTSWNRAENSRRRRVSSLVLCCTDLKPQLEDVQRRLDDAKTKQSDVMKDLEMVQNNLNFTTSTHTHTHTFFRNTKISKRQLGYMWRWFTVYLKYWFTSSSFFLCDEQMWVRRSTTLSERRIWRTPRPHRSTMPCVPLKSSWTNGSRPTGTPTPPTTTSTKPWWRPTRPVGTCDDGVASTVLFLLCVQCRDFCFVMCVRLKIKLSF